MEKPQFKQTHFCWICGNTVDLATCKVDEHRMAVHGDCYLLRVALASESMVRKPAQRIQSRSVRSAAQ
jgi:ribosome-binding protein aMBF1 (putative translation factor)